MLPIFCLKWFMIQSRIFTGHQSHARYFPRNSGEHKEAEGKVSTSVKHVIKIV